MLSKLEAETLVIGRLSRRYDAQRIQLQSDRTIERHFGWIFLCEVTESSEQSSDSSRKTVTKPFIVNKSSGQVVSTSKDYSPDQFIKIYEKFLAESIRIGQEWCLTFDGGKQDFSRDKLIKAVERQGFYEIS